MRLYFLNVDPFKPFMSELGNFEYPAVPKMEQPEINGLVKKFFL